MEGETVKVLGDGEVLTEKTVSGGSINLSDAASKVIVGLPFTYKLQPMRLDVTTEGGTTHGSIKKISELSISFYETLNAKYGCSDDELFDIDWPSTTLYTGEQVVTFDGGFDVEDPIIITGSDPLPCTVRSIVVRMEKTGR